MPRRLMIISCSASKNHELKLLPAIERYTGAWYEVIKKLRREGRWPQNLDVIIISAKYGFLRSTDLIEDYDRIMDEERARQLNPAIIGKLKQLLNENDYDSVFINLGKKYMPAINGLNEILPPNMKISYGSGGIGPRKGQIRQWVLMNP